MTDSLVFVKSTSLIFPFNTVEILQTMCMDKFNGNIIIFDKFKAF